MAASTDKKIKCVTSVKNLSTGRTQGFPSNMSAEAMSRQVTKAREMARFNRSLLGGHMVPGEIRVRMSDCEIAH